MDEDDVPVIRVGEVGLRVDPSRVDRHPQPTEDRTDPYTVGVVRVFNAVGTRCRVLVTADPHDEMEWQLLTPDQVTAVLNAEGATAASPLLCPHHVCPPDDPRVLRAIREIDARLRRGLPTGTIDVDREVRDDVHRRSADVRRQQQQNDSARRIKDDSFRTQAHARKLAIAQNLVRVLNAKEFVFGEPTPEEVGEEAAADIMSAASEAVAARLAEAGHPPDALADYCVVALTASTQACNAVGLLDATEVTSAQAGFVTRTCLNLLAVALEHEPVYAFRFSYAKPAARGHHRDIDLLALPRSVLERRGVTRVRVRVRVRVRDPNPDSNRNPNQARLWPGRGVHQLGGALPATHQRLRARRGHRVGDDVTLCPCP